jgi:hypothetical protein
VWDLTDWESGVFLANQAVLGLMEPPATRFTSTSPALAGSRYRGQQILERPVTWPVHIWAGNGLDWLRLHRRFWAALSRSALATWRVFLPDGQTRDLWVRLVGSGPHGFDRDPVHRGWALFTVELVAEDPWWRGPQVFQQWSDTPDEEFFGGPTGGGKAPLFYLSSSSTLGQASMTNPGDEPAWPVWTVSVTDQVTAVTLGVGDAQIVLTGLDLSAGDVLVIDTDPRVQSVTINGSRVRGLLASAGFAPIPPGSAAELNLVLTGEGTVQAAIVPRWARCL